MKESGERAGIFLLVEHKAQKNPSLLLVQLLGYMASMLNKQQDEREAGKPLDDESSFLELVFFAMRKIFDLKGKGRDEILKELFSKGEKLPDKVWEKLMQEIGEYIMNVHPDISVKILSEAEEKAGPFMKKKRRKVMQMLKTSVERAKEQGLEKGLEQDLEQGREEERREIALNFLEAGINPKIVAKNTGLSLQAVKSLLKTPPKGESP